jgi:hypothetical protein
VAHARTPFPPEPARLSVSLGVAPCAVNWATPALASVTTPLLSALCGNASGAGGGGDGGECGIAPLVVAFLGAPGFLPLPAAYPPLLPTAEWGPQLAALGADPHPAPATPLSSGAALVGLPPHLLLASAAALAPAGVGIRVVSRCVGDPTYAPPEACAVINSSQPLLNASGGQQCVWGTGDACLPCPRGALCPGGAVLLPLPGFWAPAPSSPPSDVFPCPAPDAAARCPGFAVAPSVGGVYGCGVGYRGQVCAACDAGYFRSLGACARCPHFSAWALLRPVVVFVGCLAALGALLAGAVWAALRRAGKRAGAADAAAPVGELLVWAWVAAQGLASLFSQAQALAPPALAPLFAAAAALQFQGVALDPACFQTATPFLPFFAATGVVLGCYCVAGAALCALRRRPAPAPARRATFFLYAAALVLSLGYGALTAEFAAAVVCTAAAPMTVVDYLQANSDGAALLARFPQLSTANLNTLRAASTNPLAAAASGLTATLQATLRVSVVAADPFKVCGEGAHRHVRPAAVVLVLAFTLFFPLLHLCALRADGRLKGLRRTAWGARLCCDGGGAAAQRGAAPRPLAEALNGALGDPALTRRTAWFSAVQRLQLALITGLVAASRARLTAPLYVALQSAAIFTSALFCAVVATARLFTPRDAWKRPVVLLLNFATGAAALVNLLLLVLDEEALRPAERAAIAWVPLVLAVVTAATLLVAWLRALYAHTLSGGVAGAGVGAAPRAESPPPTPPPPLPAADEGEGRRAIAPSSRRASRHSHRTLRRLASSDGDEDGFFHGWLKAHNPLRDAGRRSPTQGNGSARAVSPPPPPPPPPLHSNVDPFSDDAPFAVDRGATVIKPHWRRRGGDVWENTQSGASWVGPPPPLARAPLSAWRVAVPFTAVDALFVSAGARDSKALAYVLGGGGGDGATAPAAGACSDSPLLRAVAAAEASAATTLWQRTPSPPFSWVCAATGAAARRDRDLPTGARTPHGWVLARDGEDRWWWHAEQREAAWVGPWVEAEREKERAAAVRARVERARRDQQRRAKRAQRARAAEEEDP